MSAPLLVTGDSGGIGRACALLAAENGWAVGVNYREDARAADEVIETMARAGSRGVAIKGDVAVENDAVGMFDVATRALGPLTAVIANAGIVAPMSRLVDMGTEWMRHIFEVDVLRVRPRGRPTAIKILRRSRRLDCAYVVGRARLGSPNLYVDYAASKGAIDRARTLGATAPLGRPGTVEEIAAAATWLISDAASLRDRRAAGRFGRALSGDLNESGPKPRSRQFDALGHAP